MTNDSMQQNILIALQDIQTALERKNNTLLLMFRANIRENNTSFIIQFEIKFRTPILISKWCIELEKKIQGSDEVVIEYAKTIRKRTKDSFLYKKIKNRSVLCFLAPSGPERQFHNEYDNQKIHLGSTLLVFALAFQMAATSFVTQTQDPNEQLIDGLTANLTQLLKPLAQAQPPFQRQQNCGLPVCYYCRLTGHFSRDCNNSSLTINNNVLNQRPNHVNINFFEENPLVEATKKKKAKVDFALDPNKTFKSTVNNNELPKTKVFKNPSKLELPKIVQKSRPYSVVKNLMETSVHIIFGQLMTHSQFRKDFYKFLILKKKTPKTNKHLCQARLTDNSNVTPLICKAQVAEAIDKKINELSTKLITNVNSNKKKSLDIAKAVSVQINNISIETNIKVSKVKKYTIIVRNKWLKKAKVLIDYELCELIIRCISKQNQKEKQLDESNNNESNEEEDQKEQKKTAELAYTIFTSNGKLLDNVKANKEGIMVNGKVICWPYYDILRRTFNRKPGKKAKYSYWWYSPCANDKYKSCLIYYKDWEPISLIPREEPKEVQKFFKSKLPKIQLLVVKQKEPSSEEKKVDIENLLAKNSPVISKEGDTFG
ncbi:hypothetical protein G9A89_019816 [Geosiphon pyriformis]|nr:hypothetical protein G9A89_019816 [Geosiphon pyriformis]